MLFVTLLTIASGLLFTMADFYKMPYRSTGDLLVIVMQFGVIEVATFMFLWLISCKKYVFAVVFPIFTMASAVAAYFRLTANVTLTPMAIDLALVNDARTTMDVVTWQLVAYILVCTAAGVAAVAVRFRHVKVKHEWVQMAVAAVAFGMYMQIPRFAAPI